MAHDQAERPTGTRIVIRLATRAIVAVLFLTAAVLGTVGGVLFAYGDDLPEITALDDYRPNTITRILASNGEVIGEFATERRVVIGYDDMAPVLRQAIMGTEDADFEQHFGLSISRIAMTAVKDVFTGQRAGASTITQQLAKNLYLSPSRNPFRKLRELIITRRLEHELSKTRIFELYLNEIEWGDGIYGAEAASRTYFGSSASSLGPDQAALMAGAIVNPRLLNIARPNGRLRNRQRIIRARMGNVTPPPVITAPVDPGPLPEPHAAPEPSGDMSPQPPAEPVEEGQPAQPPASEPATETPSSTPVPQTFPGASQP
jgi:membrane peptidoglycan carboxypeptidase